MSENTPVASSPWNAVPLPDGAGPYELLGMRMYAMTMPQWTESVGRAVADGSRLLVVSNNLHGAYVGQRNTDVQAVRRLALARIDGMVLVLLGRLLGYPLRREHRLTWVDWLRPLLAEAAVRGWRVFFVAGKPGIGDRAAAILREEIAGLDLHGVHGHFDQEPGHPENDAVLAAIEAAAPDVLLVGLGMPHQERWVARNLERIPCRVILTCGAALDYVAGVQAAPPRWAASLGFEWLCRLMAQPRRLAWRYLGEPWFLVVPYLRDIWRRLRS